MRYPIFFLSLCLITASAGGASYEEDEYSIQQVRRILKLPKGATIGLYTKRLRLMGDRVAIALIKIYDREEIKNPDLVRHYLPRIREAFADPSQIVRETDREPKVALLLLDSIKRETPDLELRSEIDAFSKELLQLLEKK